DWWFWGVDAVAADHVWAVGNDGCIAHYDGLSWTTQVSGTTRALRAISGCDPSHVWAVGEGGVILRWDGANWSAQTSGVEYALYGVTALAPDQAWAVGAYGTILRWDGLAWTAHTSGVEEAIWSVSAFDANNAWAVCGEGLILRWDGRQWNHNRWRSRGKQDWWFWGVSAVSTDCVWAVGQEDSERGIIFQGQSGGRPVAVETVETPVYEPWIEPGETLPARVDLRGEMPPIKDQTLVYPGRQTCQAWAGAYYQLTQWIKHFRRPGWDLTRPEYQMSPTFLYHRGSLGLIGAGCVDMADFPFDPSIPYYDTADQREAAKAYSVQGYENIWTNSGAAPYPDSNIETAKYWLAHGYVLSGGVSTEHGDFPDSYQTPPGAFYDPPGKPLGANHEVVLCGYDDNINPSASDPLHRGGFLMANCWGDHWNGEMRGYVWISYAWAKNYVETMRVLFGNGPNGPAIMGCSPTNAIVGAAVTIVGDGFGALRRQAGVTFNGVAAPVSSFSNETIRVTVPAGAASGPLIVHDWEGTASNPVDFQVDP
ncbi:MAG: IPT/TIG domain-containing protein, partial [Lentisphaerota bacterium]